MITDRLGLGALPGGMAAGQKLKSGLGQAASAKADSNKGSAEKSEAGGGFAKLLNSSEIKPSRTTPAESPTEETLSVVDEGNPARQKGEPEFFIQAQSSQVKPLTDGQKAMLKFMDSMESEFNIPPERIVEALVNLNPSDQAKDPELTATQMIEQLDLEPEDHAKAELMYMEMLGSIPRQSMLPTEPLPRTVPQSGYGLEVASAAGAASILSKQDKKAALNASLDRMNEQFFVNPRLQDPLQPSLYNQTRPMELDPATRLALMQDPSVAGARGKMIQAYKDLEPVSPEDIPAPYQELAKKLATFGAAASALQTQGPVTASLEQSALPLDPANADFIPQGDLQAIQLGQQDLGAWQESGSFASGGQTLLEGNEPELGELKKSSSSAEEFSAITQLSGQERPARVDRSAEIMPLSTPLLANKQESADNIQQIMDRAQYVIRRGGGEATVKLNPEGMGEVHLKIMVQDGKVQVAMSTETKEAKQMIESSLSDLKSSLNSHKLSVDMVKVDIGRDANLDLSNQQSRMDFQQDQAREQARNFLGQFRDSNSFSRGQFFDMNPEATRAYANSGKKQPEPLREEPVRRKSRYQGTNKGTGLDLVA